MDEIELDESFEEAFEPNEEELEEQTLAKYEKVKAKRDKMNEMLEVYEEAMNGEMEAQEFAYTIGQLDSEFWKL